MILVATVEDKAKIGRLIGLDQGAPIHYAPDFFKALCELEPINDSINCRKGGKDSIRIQSLFIRNIALGIESVRTCHAPAHPKYDHCICRRIERVPHRL